MQTEIKIVLSWFWVGGRWTFKTCVQRVRSRFEKLGNTFPRESYIRKLVEFRLFLGEDKRKSCLPSGSILTIVVWKIDELILSAKILCQLQVAPRLHKGFISTQTQNRQKKRDFIPVVWSQGQLKIKNIYSQSANPSLRKWTLLLHQFYQKSRKFLNPKKIDPDLDPASSKTII